MTGRLRALVTLIATLIAAEPIRTFGAVVVLVAGRASILGSAYGLKLLVDRTGAKGPAVITASIALGLAAQYPIATVGVTLRERAAMSLEEMLVRITASLPGLEHHERPEYLDKLDLLRRSNYELGDAVASLVDNIATISVLIGSCFLLAKVHPVLVLMPAGALPAFVAAIFVSRINVATDRAWGPLWRAKRGLREIAWNPRWGPELRLFGASSHLIERQTEAANELMRLQILKWTKTGLIQSAGDVVFGIAQVAAIAFVAARTAAGGAAAGDLILTVALVSRVGSQVNETIQGIRNLLRTLVTLERLRWLKSHAARPQAGGPAPEELLRGIVFENVSFTYPGTETEVLSGIDLHIDTGSSVAFVGINGAGKTTLVKLLCKFYEPSAGRITVDGTDLAFIDAEAWRQRTSAVFQDFARLEFMARESIGVGDLPAIEEAGIVMAAVDRAGMQRTISGLPDGLETQLGRHFGGVDLSGGEWQRLALARSHMRTTPLLYILDEPTAALDPQSEHALFRSISELSRRQGNITLFVSHRFSTVRMADKIVVISQGQIAEEGSHAELMEAGGPYSELYERQARAYN